MQTIRQTNVMSKPNIVWSPNAYLPGNSVYVTPSQAVRLLQQQRSSIQKIDIIPPKLGTSGLGRIKITFK